MKKSVASFGKKVLACACSVALSAALVPAAALAAGDGTGTGGGSGSGSADYVLQVQIQDQKTEQIVKLKSNRYTQDDLEKLAAANTDRVSVNVATKSANRVYSTTNYVTLDQVLDGVDKWTEGSSVVIAGSDNFSTTQSYSDVMADRYFYPGYSADDPSSEGARVVKPVIALTDGYKAVTSTAGEAEEALINGEADKTGVMRFLMGSADLDSITPGNVCVADTTTVTVVYPHEDFQVVAKNAKTGEESVVASYSDEQLEQLAAANTTAANYLLGSGVYSASKYVTVKQLLSDSKIWKAGSSAAFTAPDGFSYSLTYEDSIADQYFYPNYSSEEHSDAEKGAVEPILALAATTGKLSGTSTAADIIEDAEAMGTDTGMPRFFKGATDPEDLPRGNTSPQMVSKVVVTYTPADEPVKPADDGNKSVKEVTANTKTVTAKSLAAAVKAAGGDVKTITSITLGSKVKTIKASAFKAFPKLKTVTLGKNVKTIKKNAFKGSKVKTVVVKSKKLTKKSVKGSLKGSKVKTIKVDVSKKKAADKKYVKKYKKIFTKKNAGKKAAVKR